MLLNVFLFNEFRYLIYREKKRNIGGIFHCLQENNFPRYGGLWGLPGPRRRGVVINTNAQLHSTKLELKFCAGSNPTRSVSEIYDGRNL